MKTESEERVRESWKSSEAQKLLDAYYKAKARGRQLHTPEQWAGGLMVVHGGYALEALASAKRYGVRVPKTTKVRRLLEVAINEEVAAEHGEVECHACGHRGRATTEWRCRLRRDGEQGWWWACPSCAPSLVGPAV
jgi:lipopolysaccharide biosynthesis regulator YciM